MGRYFSFRLELDEFQPRRADVADGTRRAGILPVELTLPQDHALPQIMPRGFTFQQV
ncbi:MAG TPA: hypothetical protein VKC66_00235 [Xanthobacteraceae bacterium]|nr:hypothetical protein [Xanthobacteraceae bacterium]